MNDIDRKYAHEIYPHNPDGIVRQLAEEAAAKRIGYEAVLQGDPPSLAGWVDGFRDTVVATYNDNARYYRTRAARLRRMAEKAARQQEVYVALSVKGANDARLVARAVAREQRKAARS